MTAVAGWRVDGYGVLAGYAVEGLSPGLSVVAGPNEAGKSTLLDFLRGVLFGFPDRRSRLPAREPLRGGRHGGRVDLVDDGGRRWALTRYAGTRAPQLLGPDGLPAGPDELAALLGGADASLFRSVFAFGLDELASFAALDSEAVRDAVFSAGVLGAGRSAVAAARALRQRREALARPRQPDAPANRLLAELGGLEDELAAARRDAASYLARRAEHQRLAAAVVSERARGDELRRRLGELDRLAACWPVQLRADAAREELAALGLPGARAEALLSDEARLERLAGERSGHGERQRRRAQLAAQLAGIDRERAQLLVQLGPAAGDEPGPADPGRGARAGLAALRDAEALLGEQRCALAALAAAQAEWERSATEREQLEGAAAGRAGEAPEADELDELELALAALGAESAELERLRLLQAATEQARRLARLAAARSAAVIAATLVLLGVAALALAAVALEHARSSAGGVLAPSLGAMALVAALVLLARAELRRRHEPAASSTAPEGERVSACAARVAELAGRLGLDPPAAGAAPGPGELAACASRLALARGRRAELDACRRELTRACAAERGASRRLGERRRAAEEVASRASRLASSCGLEHRLGPEGLVAALGCLAELAELQAARDRVQLPLGELEAATADHDAEVAALWETLPGPSGPRPVSSDDTLAALLAEQRRALEQRELAAKAARTIRECEEELERQLGTGGSGALLRRRLTSGAVVDWDEERRLLGVELEVAGTAYEAAVAEQRDAARALHALERSGGVADLELRRAGRLTELERTLEQWCELSLAESLLGATLARYERERQPAVVGLAAALFRDVTAGRYQSLLARVEGDGRGPGIDALNAAGERVDCASLSRGTAEQLYLCLRLAYASDFAERAVSLPLVLDDVLVNFDPERARAVAGAVASVAASHQVLAFTCHPQVAELFLDAAPGTRVVELPQR